MTTPRESKPTTVPFGATPAGEPKSLRDWANPAVWTDRMLTTLATGVQGGKWHTLNDKVYSRRNLEAACTRVQGNHGAAGVDHQSVADFAANRVEELTRLANDLRTDAYRPQAIQRVWIPKPGRPEQRPLGVPTVRDRVVQTALVHVLEPILDATFAEHSYGFRPGRGCHPALERVEQLLDEGHVYVVDADLQSYFDTIPHDRLLALLRERVSDPRILRWVQMFLEQGVLDGLTGWAPEAGTPQGAVLSPLLANLYLNPLDHLLAGAGFAMVRYADDFVILCRSRADADRALAQVQQWVADNGLTLHPTKTRIVDARTEGFDFLGYHFRGSLRLPRKQSLAKVKDAVRAKTIRTAGTSLDVISQTVSQTLRGWFTYFRHSCPTVFRALDSWVRMRLRSILRRRQGRRGRGRGADHQRWPNAFFDAQGLYSLSAAHERYCQSPLG